jgi:CIC family chloride channel protein
VTLPDKSDLITQSIADENDPARSEVKEYLTVRQMRRWIFPRAALVGACAGLVALLFRIVLSSVDSARTQMIHWAQIHPGWGWVFPIGLAIIGSVGSVLLTMRIAPEAAGSGIPHLKGVLQRLRELNWKRVLPVKFIGGVIAIGSGMALGREGPTVQMGGAIGDAISRLLKVQERERLTLISAGAGAGLAAAFNAPLSGLIFILEEVRQDFQPIVFGATFIAAVVADIISRIGSGQYPVFEVPAYPVPPLTSLPFFIVLGLLAGLAGVVYNRSLIFSLDFFAKFNNRSRLLAIAVVGGLIGITGWFFPLFIGSGHGLAELTLKGTLVLGFIPLIFLLRFLLTTASYGSGAPGGIFAPLLVLGALIGLGLGEVFQLLAPKFVPIPGVFAVVGMAAFFTAIVRAPLTGIMLIIEMTGNYEQMLPLLVSCFVAYIIAEAFKELPIYEALLERDLRKGGSFPHISDPIVTEFLVQDGAPFVGLPLKMLGLPPGVIIVHCSDGKREWVPKANTRLEANMRLTVVVAPESIHGMELLRKGCQKSLSEKE